MALSAAPQKAHVNVTPLIDVLLVLLIIFMVVINPASQGLEAENPQPAISNAASSAPWSTILQIRADGTMSLDREPIEAAALAERLSYLLRMHANTTFFVGADRETGVAAVIHAIDVARGVGLKRVGLLSSHDF